MSIIKFHYNYVSGYKGSSKPVKMAVLAILWNIVGCVK